MYLQPYGHPRTLKKSKSNIVQSFNVSVSYNQLNKVKLIDDNFTNPDKRNLARQLN